MGRILLLLLFILSTLPYMRTRVFTVPIYAMDILLGVLLVVPVLTGKLDPRHRRLFGLAALYLLFHLPSFAMACLTQGTAKFATYWFVRQVLAVGTMVVVIDRIESGQVSKEKALSAIGVGAIATATYALFQVLFFFVSEGAVEALNLFVYHGLCDMADIFEPYRHYAYHWSVNRVIPRGFGGFWTSTVLGGALAIFFPISLQIQRPVLRYLATGSIVLGVILSGSRHAWLAVFLCGIYLVYTAVREGRGGLLRQQAGLIALGLVGALAATVWIQGYQSRVRSLLRIWEDPAALGRASGHVRMVEFLGDHPWMILSGKGFATRQAIVRGESGDVTPSIFDLQELDEGFVSDSIALLLLDKGIAVFLLYLAILLYAFRHAATSLDRAALVVLVLVSLMDNYMHESPAMTAIGWMVIGLAVARSPDEEAAPATPAPGPGSDP